MARLGKSALDPRGGTRPLASAAALLALFGSTKVISLITPRFERICSRAIPWSFSCLVQSIR